jgi:hypothetical protein
VILKFYLPVASGDHQEWEEPSNDNKEKNVNDVFDVVTPNVKNGARQ